MIYTSYSIIQLFRDYVMYLPIESLCEKCKNDKTNQSSGEVWKDQSALGEVW